MGLARVFLDLLHLLHLLRQALLGLTTVPLRKQAAWTLEVLVLWRRVVSMRVARDEHMPAVQGIQALYYLPTYEHLLCAAVEAKHAAKRATDQARMAGLAGWAAWARRATEGGAKAGHRWTRMVPAILKADAVPPDVHAHPHTLANREMDKWTRIWQKHGECLDPCELIPTWDEGLPDCSVQGIRESASLFPQDTGLGVDRLPPKLLATASDESLIALRQIYKAVEAAGCWPEGVLQAIMVSRAKDSGGYRLIAMLPTLYRVWARLRLGITAQWLEAHRHECFWTERGKSSSLAALHHNLCSELAVEEGGGSATTLLDMWKAYETVPWSCLVREARDTGFSMLLLRLILGMYAAPRRGSGPANRVSCRAARMRLRFCTC